MIDLKFDIGDDVVIIDHVTKEFLWTKGQVVGKLDDDNIFVYIDVLKSRTKVNDRQIMIYDDLKDFLHQLGADEEDFTEWDLSAISEGDYDNGSRDCPPIPDLSPKPCTCEMTELMRYGCRCINGRKQLEKEENDSKR